ncbi:MAG TPA: ATP-binding protein [Candidatus Hydrogenedens sp.]|nr:ATP-binding protein [Candidatus Hydrogenedens sp.]HOL18992.1 ATP-binding protein [Candidatus Hydrogenedens sp.]HPP58956.1 ATP-binding protein [Candidatus Hydrogenedens sp.]
MREETFNVLVVDDEPGIRIGVARVLQNFSIELTEVDCKVSFTVDTVNSAEEAIEKIKTKPPHILLLDNKLPGMSGLEALEKIVAMKLLETYTVIITAYASIETAVKATKHGAYDFLPKPFTPTDLKSTIHKVVKQLIIERKARELEEEKKRMRFEFISLLAHELKAPLNAVDGYLRILKDMNMNDNPQLCQDLLERCLIRNDYMRKMINDLLDLTRIESGQKKRDITEVNLNELAKLAIETSLVEAQKRNITITLHAEEPVIIRADRDEMIIILNNLISNAVKYNKDNGKVDIYLQKEHNKIIIKVSDTGIGMTPEECAKLFQDFVRIRNKKTESILGSGLGLSTVKKLAQIYGGDVSVHSVPDEGSTFTVELCDYLEKDANPS